jgi:hypothetical protein
MESGYDNGYVEISANNGSTWNTVDQRSGGATSWRTNSISLNSYSGQDIIVRFRLTSDGSVVYSGWYIDNVHVVRSGGTTPLDVSISSLNHQNFPHIIMDVDIENATSCPAEIPQTSFTVFEDGVVQTDLFSVIPPSQVVVCVWQT